MNKELMRTKKNEYIQGGVRHSAWCPYSAAEPSWAMVRCYYRSHPPIKYTACVGLSLMFYKVTVGKKEKRWRLTFAECLQAEIRRLPAWLAGWRRAGRRLADELEKPTMADGHPPSAGTTTIRR